VEKDNGDTPINISFASFEVFMSCRSPKKVSKFEDGGKISPKAISRKGNQECEAWTNSKPLTPFV